MKLNKVKAKTALLVSGKTQCELAESLNLSRRWVGAAFNGEKSISEKAARSIAAALETDITKITEQEE